MANPSTIYIKNTLKKRLKKQNKLRRKKEIHISCDNLSEKNNNPLGLPFLYI